MPLFDAQGIVIVMLCPKCGKESNNVRVCAHCQTPYPIGSLDPLGASRSARGTATWRRGDPRSVIANLSAVQRWAGIGLLVIVTVWISRITRERDIPVGVIVPNLIAAPMSADEAASTLKTIKETAQVEMREGELSVRIAAATFPLQRHGQLALAQQYTRADYIIEGRKRAINFLDPDGNRFARADPEKGVAMTR